MREHVEPSDGTAVSSQRRARARTQPAGDVDAAEALRGRLFTDLDRLAFALEVEAAQALEAGDEALAVRLEDRRLGVRLAQRLVAGVHADEVDQRIERARRAYDQRLDGPGP